MVRDCWVLGATVLIYMFFFLRTVSAQTPGKYYTSPDGMSSTCLSPTCPTCPNNWLYNAGCTGSRMGTCTNCSNAGVFYYHSGNRG